MWFHINGISGPCTNPLRSLCDVYDLRPHTVLVVEDVAEGCWGVKSSRVFQCCTVQDDLFNSQFLLPLHTTDRLDCLTGWSDVGTAVKVESSALWVVHVLAACVWGLYTYICDAVAVLHSSSCRIRRLPPLHPPDVRLLIYFVQQIWQFSCWRVHLLLLHWPTCQLLHSLGLLYLTVLITIGLSCTFVQ